MGVDRFCMLGTCVIRANALFIYYVLLDYQHVFFSQCLSHVRKYKISFILGNMEVVLIVHGLYVVRELHQWLS